MRESELTGRIIGGAIEVHKHWGPGLYEEIYERSLYHELQLREVAFESQVKLPLLFRDPHCKNYIKDQNLRMPSHPFLKFDEIFPIFDQDLMNVQKYLWLQYNLCL